MDGLSAAASVAGVAAVGVKLSKTLYEIITTIQAGKEEIREIAEHVSLLNLVLEGLQDVLDHEKLHLRPALEESAHTIVSRCESIFKSIEKHTGDGEGRMASKVVWYFKRVRVKPLRASLESLKSTLNVLLHVIQLAKTIQEAVKSPTQYTENWTIRKERRSLVGEVLQNRAGVARLKILEEETLREILEFNVNGSPYIYDENSPLPDVFHRKVKSDQDFEFVGPANSGSPSSPTEGEKEYGHLRPWERSNHATPVRQHSQGELHNSMEMGTSSRRRERDFTHDRGARSASPHGNKSERRTTSQPPSSATGSSPQPLTSRLILGIIPHEKADKDIHFPETIPEPERLEIRAQSTANTLLKEWTNVPAYTFSTIRPQTHQAINPPVTESSHHQSRLPSTAAENGSMQEERSKDTNHAQPGASSSKMAEANPESADGGPEDLDSNQDESRSIIDDADAASQVVGPGPGVNFVNDKSKPGKKSKSSGPSREKRRPTNTQPSVADDHSYGPSSSNHSKPMQPRPMYHYPMQPNSIQPYPPQPHSMHPSLMQSNPIQAQYQYPPFFSPTPPAPDPPPSSTQNPAAPVLNPSPIDITKSGTSEKTDKDSTDTTMAVVEKVLGFLERPHKEMGALEAKQRKLEEELRTKAAVEKSQQQATSAQEAIQNSMPITLQDCIGRRFIFPVEMCRSWWVS